MYSNVQIGNMIQKRPNFYFITSVRTILDISQLSYTYIINLLILFAITENCMPKSLRIYLSFMTVGPGFIMLNGLRHVIKHT